MMLTRLRSPMRAAAVAHEHVSDELLSDLLDARVAADVRASIESHMSNCRACAERSRGLEAIVALGTLERVTTRTAPDQWQLIAACTLHERRLRAFFARQARVRSRAWILVAVLSGVLLTEGIRQSSAMIAKGAAWVAAKASAYAPPIGRSVRSR